MKKNITDMICSKGMFYFGIFLFILGLFDKGMLVTSYGLMPTVSLAGLMITMFGFLYKKILKLEKKQ